MCLLCRFCVGGLFLWWIGLVFLVWICFVFCGSLAVVICHLSLPCLSFCAGVSPLPRELVCLIWTSPCASWVVFRLVYNPGFVNLREVIFRCYWSTCVCPFGHPNIMKDLWLETSILLCFTSAYQFPGLSSIFRLPAFGYIGFLHPVFCVFSVPTALWVPSGLIANI